MKKKLFRALSLCLIVACSFILLPACDWFDRDTMKVTLDGDKDPNAPSAQYSNFLSAVHSTQDYTGSYRCTTSTETVDNTFEIALVDSIKNLELSTSLESSTKTEQKEQVCVDIENGAVFKDCKIRSANEDFTWLNATLVRNIKTSNEDNAQDYYIERTLNLSINDFSSLEESNYKTQKERVKKYPLTQATLLSRLPNFDASNLSKNIRILGDSSFSLIDNLEMDFLNYDSTKIKVYMPQRESIFKIEVTSKYETSGTYKYVNYSTSITYTCSNGKISQITQTRAIKKASKDTYANKDVYEKVNVKTCTVDINYIDDWNQSVTETEYNNIFNPTSIKVKSTDVINEDVKSYFRTNRDSMPATTNNLFVNIQGVNYGPYKLEEGTFKEMSSIISDYGKKSAYIMQEDKSLAPTQIDIKFYSDAEYKNEIDTASARTGMPYDTTIYGKYVIPNNYCVVIVKENIQAYPKLEYYYVATPQSTTTSKLGNFIINVPIICPVENHTFEHYDRDIKYSEEYLVTTYVDNNPSTSNMPLSYHKDSVITLDYYLIRKTNI